MAFVLTSTFSKVHCFPTKHSQPPDRKDMTVELILQQAGLFVGDGNS